MITLILLICAAICHALAAFGVQARVSWSELGWCLFTVAVAAMTYGGAR